VATIAKQKRPHTDGMMLFLAQELDYILGNPRNIGGKMMTSDMRNQLLALFPKRKRAGVLDFVTACTPKQPT
jgi:hypothetical protein